MVKLLVRDKLLTTELLSAYINMHAVCELTKHIKIK